MRQIKHPNQKLKYCPKCSSEGFYDLTDHAFKCHGCGFQFFLNSSAAVAALIFNENGQLLLVERGVEPKLGMLDLPGGFVDPHESAEEAVIREIKEELDVRPDRIEYMMSEPNEYNFMGITVFTVDLAFRCFVTDFSSLTYRDDISGIQFMKPEQIKLEDVAFDSIRNIIKTFKNEAADR